MNRRTIVIVAATLAVVAGASTAIVQPWQSSARAALVTPTDDVVAVAEQARAVPGAGVRQVELVAQPASVTVAGRTVATWTFNGTVPGPQITARAGDVVRAQVLNRLPTPLTVHWHGIVIRNDMDGVPDVTQTPIEPGGTFTYQFTVANPGTYFYHSHVGAQLDRGLYGALVVQPGSDAATATPDVAVLLDDWVDGTGRSPDDVYADLRKGSTMPGMSPSSTGHDMSGMDMSGMDMSGTDMSGTDTVETPTSPLGSDTADLDYPAYLINGRSPDNPAEIAVPAGQQVRLRLINAASATPFRVAVDGRQLTVVATDGYPVEPVTVDTLIIGMGERYDVTLTAPKTGTAALVAVAEGRSGQSLAVLRAGPGPSPVSDTRPTQLSGRLLTYADLHAAKADAVRAAAPDATYRIDLTGNMNSYNWGVTTSAGDGTSVPVRQGQRVRLVITNRTMMWHPMHLHGHTFELVNGPTAGPRKDTVIVPPMGSVTIDVTADNPGQWVLHCHNIYHAEAGMMTMINYVK